MNTYLLNTHSRKEMIVANSICHEHNLTIKIFDAIDIYDICFKDPECVIVLSEKSFNNIYIEKFITNIYNNNIQTKCKIFVLQKTKNIQKHNNIYPIPEDSFYSYNEYIHFNIIDKKYVLCDLNCINQKKNGIIQDILYPNNIDIIVKLVNCPRFDHPQNLGIVNDYEMLKLISECSVFIGLTDNYVYDAINMKKQTITIQENNIIDIHKSICMNDIAQKIDDKILDDRKNNLQKYKISNIIKYVLK